MTLQCIGALYDRGRARAGPAELPRIRPSTDGAIALRPWAEADLDVMVAICSDPDVARFTRVPDPYTDADARAWFDAQPGRLAAGEGVTLRDRRRWRGRSGASACASTRPTRDIAEAGYMVGRAARGRGVATAALRLASRWGLRDLGVARVQLTTHLDNAASQRVAERAGFRREGVLRSWEELRGTARRPRDVLARRRRPVTAPIRLPAAPGRRPAGLRPWREGDVAAILAMSRDPETIRFTSVPDPYDEDSVRIWLALQPARLRAGDGAAFAVVEPPARCGARRDRGAGAARARDRRDRLPHGARGPRPRPGDGGPAAALGLVVPHAARRAAAADDAPRQPRVAAGGGEGRLHPRGGAARLGRPARRAGRPDHVLAPPR